MQVNYKQKLFKMRLSTFSQHSVLLLTVISMLCLMGGSSAEKKPKCEVCQGIVDKFMQGIKRTQKSNFGGGNTHWEEKSLGKYEFSETRLIEITENLCAKKDPDCHAMCEEYEELLEKWWFLEYAKSTQVDLHTFFCINNVKVCCPFGTYGPSCKDCPGGRITPCKGNGKCKGNGTREGDGKCECKSGYRGDLCDECKDNYYEENKNDTHVICKICHDSCKSTCWEAGPKGCDECKAGWTQEESEGCVDINECEAETPPCKENQFCKNTAGSFRCTACDVACKACTDKTAANCVQCADRFYDNEGICAACHKSCATSCTGPEATNCDACKEGWEIDTTEGCKDVNECEVQPGICPESHYCTNNEGSYKCNDCHSACKECTAYGPESCLSCAQGYKQSSGVCEDVDECESGNPCEGANEKCKNTQGSFTCGCNKNFQRKDGVCVKKPKEKKSKQSKEQEMMRKFEKMKDKKPRGKSRKKDLSLDHLKFAASLLGYVTLAFLLRRSWLAQLVFSFTFWVYLFWFSLRFDKLKRSDLGL